MNIGYPPSLQYRTEQRARRIKGTARGYWYSMKSMTWLSCVVCAAAAFFIAALIFCWIAAGFFLTARKADLDIIHPDGFYGPVIEHHHLNKCAI